MEIQTLPSIVLQLLERDFASVAVADCVPSLDRARLTKTRREIQLLRNAARVLDAGQIALVRAAREFSDTTELGVWAAVSTAVMEAADKPSPVTLIGELVTGPRTAVVRYPGGPQPRRIAAGDTGILDISVRVDGYWGDCNNAVVFGKEPTQEQKKYFKATRDGFEAAVATLRPGVRCCDTGRAHINISRGALRAGFL